MRARRASEALRVRKQPSQGRSQARLDRIVAVAEEMIVESGLLGLSIREVVRRANANIATFYQFFPSRGSLTRHIVELYNAKLEASLTEALQRASGARDARASLALLQSAMVAFYASHPVTREIWPSIHADHGLRELDRQDSERNAAKLAPLLRRLRPQAAPSTIDSAATLIVLMSGPVFRHAVTLPPAERRRLLAQHLEMTTALVERL